MTLRNTLATFAVLALAAGLSPALADNGKSNGQGATHGNSGSNGNASSGSQATTHGNSAKHAAVAATPDKHGLASELKGLNAVKANANALEHANPNSQVGRIAAYRDAALATAEVAGALADAEAVRDALPVPARTVAAIDADIVAIDAAIGLLDTASPTYDADLAALQADRVLIVDELDLTVAQNLAIADAQLLVDAAAANLDAAQGLEDDALLTASNGRTLSDEAIAYIRAVLGL